MVYSTGVPRRAERTTLLRKIDQFVDFKPFERMCEPMYKPSKRGKPSVPIIVALKCLIVQYLYDLSDPALEDALIDRLSFQRFAGITFDTEIPDYSTIWRFRDRLIKAGLLDTIFTEVLRADRREGTHSQERNHSGRHAGEGGPEEAYNGR